MTVTRKLAAWIMDLHRSHDRVLVGIDGPDAAGKTTLATTWRSLPRRGADHGVNHGADGDGAADLGRRLPPAEIPALRAR